MTTDLLLTWLPLVVILLVMVAGVVSSRRSYRRHAARVEVVSADSIELNRQILAELREIKVILKDRA